MISEFIFSDAHENIKTCACCKQEKHIEEFGYDRVTQGGRNYYCLACTRKKAEVYRNSEHGRFHRQEYNRRLNKTPKGIYWALCRSARSAGRLVRLTADEFVEWYKCQDQRCYYCNREFEKVIVSDPHARTIDRKDNSKEYTLDNIVLCCRRCNIVKSSVFTEEEMLEIAAKYLQVDAE